MTTKQEPTGCVQIAIDTDTDTELKQSTHTDADFEQLQSQLAEAVTTHNENCATDARELLQRD